MRNDSSERQARISEIGSENIESATALRLKLELIDKTPHPVFARLHGLHDWMLGRSKMFGGVFVLRRIATSYMPTLTA
jgi:hypothetical protein